MEKITKNNDWISTHAVFTKASKQENDVDWENLGIKPPEEDLEEYEFVPFRFNIKSLVAYNKGGAPRNTVLRLMDGDSYAIGLPFDVFDEFIKNKCKRKWYE